MKLINWILSIFLMLLAMAAFEYSIIPTLLLVTAGLILLPPISPLITDKFKIGKTAKIVIVIILVLIAFYMVGLSAATYKA